MRYHYEIVVKRWLPILQEYEKAKNKVEPRAFKFIKELCRAHHISDKELRRYYAKWIQGNKSPGALLPTSIKRASEIPRQLYIFDNVYFVKLGLDTFILRYRFKISLYYPASPKEWL